MTEKELKNHDGLGQRIDDSFSCLELPCAPTLRRCNESDPFPPCEELRRWPSGFVPRELADLSESEMSEEDPQKFVYSDSEMEAWGQFVGQLLDEIEGPVLPQARRRLFLRG